MRLFAPPAFLPEFSAIPHLAESWSTLIDALMRLEVSVLENGTEDSLNRALLAGNTWFYNPLQCFTANPPSDFTETDIAWTGFPRRHLIRSPDEPFAPAEQLLLREERFVDENGRPIAGLLYRDQDEYLEWRAEYDENARLTRVTFTCEGPEYWSAFSDGAPAPYFFDNRSLDVPLDRKRRALFLETYRALVGNQVQIEDLLFDRDVYEIPLPPDPQSGVISRRNLAFPRGAYNPWNRWNTTDGIVHLTHHSNTLRAEINLAARATIFRIKNSTPNGIRIVTDTSELICAAGYGDPNRFSDPTIGAKINELARNGFAITLADPVGLYMSDLDVSGWTEPGYRGRRRPVEKDDYFRILRPEPAEARAQGRILRAICEVPAGRGFTLSDVQINGEPIRFAGQIAACITMKLTGQAIFFRKPERRDLLRFIHKCFRCKDNPDDLIVVNREDAPDKEDARLGDRSPCKGGFVAAFPNDFVGDSVPAIAPAAVTTDAEKEPLLNMEEIQGNILSGFNKDFQTFLFYRITAVEAAREWLRSFQDAISYESAVHAFNEKFRERRVAEGKEPEDMTATWLNIAFSFPGLRKLVKKVETFRDPAFALGLPARSAGLGDPMHPGAEGHPTTWVFGGPDSIPDFVLLIASDRENDLINAVKALRAGEKGVELLAQEEGRARNDGTGREQFGFRDGVSQPGIRGCINDKGDLFTQRRMPAGHPREKDFSRPGQPLVFPGQFVFGYATQSDFPDLPGPTAIAGPKWAENGSFLVFRRFKQYVDAFWKEMNRTAEQYSTLDHPVTGLHLAARLMGRLPNGTPLLRSTGPPNLRMDGDAANNFDFIDNQFALLDGFTPPQDDITGSLCPFAAHIRRVNPRDEVTDIGGAGATLRRRILRRGLIFGKPVDDVANIREEEKIQQRGLLFLCYQTSIVEQFEFLMSRWINQPLRPKPGGVDFLVGQNNQNEPRTTTITLNGITKEIQTAENFITPTGGGYFFAPSRSALREDILGAAPP